MKSGIFVIISVNLKGVLSMSDALKVEVNPDGSATAHVGSSYRTFTDGSSKENLMNAAKWATDLLYDLEGEEFG